MYRGYDIADLAERSTYEETALLLLEGDAPSARSTGSVPAGAGRARGLPAADRGG